MSVDYEELEKITPEELKKQVLTEIEKDVRKFQVDSYKASAEEGIFPTYTKPDVVAKKLLKLSLKLVPMPTINRRRRWCIVWRGEQVPYILELMKSDYVVWSWKSDQEYHISKVLGAVSFREVKSRVAEFLEAASNE